MTSELAPALVEAYPDPTIVVDPAGVIQLVNERTVEVFGHSREQMVGEPLEMLMPPRFRERHRAHVAGYFADPTVRPMGARLDLWGLRSNGEEFPIEISLAPLRNGGVHALAVIRDVSDRMERRRMTDALSYNVRGLQEIGAKVESGIEAFGAQLHRQFKIGSRMWAVTTVAAIILSLELFIQGGAHTWTCDPTNLALTQGGGSIHKRICHTVYPTSKAQEEAVLAAQKAARDDAANRKRSATAAAKAAAIVDRLNRWLDSQGAPR